MSRIGKWFKNFASYWGIIPDPKLKKSMELPDVTTVEQNSFCIARALMKKPTMVVAEEPRRREVRIMDLTWDPSYRVYLD